MKRFICFFVSCLLICTALCGCKGDDDEWEQQILEYRANKFAIYQEENARYDDYQVDVAFLGDSLTEGYDVKTYYPTYLVSNRGIGGETTIGLEERLGISLYDLKPKVAVMLIGANNMDTMFDNYENILKGFQSQVPDTRIILLSLTSMGGEWGRKNQLAAYNNVKIKMLAEQYSFSYVDLYSPLLNLESGEIYATYTTDGGHLTSLGYEVLTEQITPVLQQQLSLWKLEHQQES